MPSAKLGTPEVKLGLLPARAGRSGCRASPGSARRWRCARPAIRSAPRTAFDCGLVDRLIEGELIPHAVAYAEEVRDVRPLPKSSERQDKLNECNPETFETFLKENGRKFRGFDAPLKNVEAVKVACEKPYAEGVLDERKLFMELMSGTQAKAQQYFFFAERKANKIEGLAEDSAAARHQAVGVIGAGTMGGGISMNFLSAGIPVTIVEMGQEALDRGTGLMRKNYEATRVEGPDDRRAGREGDGLLSPTLDFDGARRLRPHHRGGLREYGREEGGVRPARQDRQAGRDPRVQHVTTSTSTRSRRASRGPATSSACTSSRRPT